VLTLTSKQQGFSLVELMIGLVILAILIAAGLPVFSLWMQNTQNRSAAESILNGLQMARTEAVRHNANVRFDFTSASGSIAWTVGCVNPVGDLNGDGELDCPAVIQSRSGGEGTGNARAGISTAAIPTPALAGNFNPALASGTGLPAGVTFTFLGRIPGVNIGTDITRIDITNAASSAARRMVITIGTGGTIRMCDPALLLANNPQGCA